MLNDTQKLQILAVHAAVKPDDTLRDALIAHAAGASRCALEFAWRVIEAHACLRQLARGVRGNGATLNLSQFEQRDDKFFWHGEEIGSLLTLYKPPLPEEWQARIAYESFLDRFADFMQRKVLDNDIKGYFVINQNDEQFQGYFPFQTQFNVDVLWKRFVEFAFSVEEIYQSFVLPLNLIPTPLGNKGKFAKLDYPIVSSSQLSWLMAFYWAEIKQDKNTHDSVSAPFPKIEKMSKAYTRNALKRLAGNAKKTRREQFSVWSDSWEREEYVEFPCIVSPKPFLQKGKITGDNNKEACYLCGAVPEQKLFDASTFVFPSSSQALQSKSTEKITTKICVSCATVTFASPIRFLGDTSFAVRIFDPDNKTYATQDLLRSFVLGELNISAGRYLLISITERVGKKLLAEKLGKIPYALWKIAQYFPSHVFEKYRVEAIIDGAKVELPTSHLAFLADLMEIYPSIRYLHDSGGKEKEERIRSLEKALNYIQKGEVISAIYTLAQHLSSKNWQERVVQIHKMQDLLSRHIARLKILKGENMAPSNPVSFLEEVAALTGILYAFVSFAETKYTPAERDEKERAIKKILEQVDDPHHFAYEVGGNTRRATAILLLRSETHFIFQQAKRFLQERLGENTEEREQEANKVYQGETRQKLLLTVDDVVNAYNEIFKGKSKKEKRDFTYALKLSLYAHFPEYIPGGK